MQGEIYDKQQKLPSQNWTGGIGVIQWVLTARLPDVNGIFFLVEQQLLLKTHDLWGVKTIDQWCKCVICLLFIIVLFVCLFVCINLTILNWQSHIKM